ncbi:MAG: threonylcarbamoyl-AMP synthase [Candidatus Marinimicrobia bacterium]|nr:threonylcarbamoyl-AMP synthase [Candidatus Neomarinimicrobiota bacterium]|tara:strand:- start:3569 stop:4492 length:924 start_codon:yes stop_codon:yes gene_type:complete
MQQKTLAEAKKRLFRGELVIFPTETVYGIGGNAENDQAIRLIYGVKKRPFDNPLICHFGNLTEIEKNFILKNRDYELAKAFWPGPLTLILKKKKESKITTLVSNDHTSVGCRIPNNEIALNLLKELGFPIAAPSANITTKTSITSINDIDIELKNIFYIDGGSSVLGLESTVIQTTNLGCKILRLGSLTIEEIKNKFSDYKIETTESKLSPGNKLKHYSPNKAIRINVKNVYDNESLLNFGKNNLKSNIQDLNLSISGNLIEASYNFYHFLNMLDKSICDQIAVAPIPNHGLGKTINDRLKRAAYED